MNPASDNGGRGVKEGLLLGAVVALGALVVLGGLFGFQRWRSINDESTLANTDIGSLLQDEAEDEIREEAVEADQLSPDSDAEAQTESTPDTTRVTPTECPDGTVAEVCAAVRFVEEETGRAFKEFPEVELLEDAAFDAELLSDFEQYKEDFDEDEIVLKATGLLDSELSLYDTFLSLLEVGVVGFYNPETGQLVVRGGELNLYAQSVLVHELAHAHDDQWYDLDREDFDNDDAEYGFSALVEGNASRVESAWVDSLSAEQAAAVESEAIAALSPEDFSRLLALPPILIQLQASPYEDGEAYVSFRANAEGEAVLEELYENPPQSSEQVLHPTDDFQPIVVVGPPAVDGEVISTGTVGELLLSFWLGDEAAVGWGGDSFATWAEGVNTCMTVDIAADSPQDLSQLEVSASRWASLATTPSRSAEVVETGDRSVLRVTGCYIR